MQAHYRRVCLFSGRGDSHHFSKYAPFMNGDKTFVKCEVIVSSLSFFSRVARAQPTIPGENIRQDLVHGCHAGMLTSFPVKN